MVAPNAAGAVREAYMGRERPTDPTGTDIADQTGVAADRLTR